MTIEVQIKDPKLFEELRHKAIYYSQRTNVIVLPDKYKGLIPDEIEKTYTQDLVTVDFKDDSFVTFGASESLIYHLGAIRPKTYTFSLKTVDTMRKLIEQELITPTKEMKEHFKPLSKRSTIGDLTCSHHRYKVGSSFKNFKGILDLELSAAFDSPVIERKNVVSLDASCYSVLHEHDSKGKEYLDIFLQYSVDRDIEESEMKIYSAIRLAELFIKPEKKLTILYDKDKRKVNRIITDSFKQDYEERISPNRETKKLLNKLPVDLYRMAYAEYLMRKNNK